MYNGFYFQSIGGYTLAPCRIFERLRYCSYDLMRYCYIHDCPGYSLRLVVSDISHTSWSLRSVSDTDSALDDRYLYNHRAWDWVDSWRQIVSIRTASISALYIRISYRQFISSRSKAEPKERGDKDCVVCNQLQDICIARQRKLAEHESGCCLSISCFCEEEVWWSPKGFFLVRLATRAFCM